MINPQSSCPECSTTQIIDDGSVIIGNEGDPTLAEHGEVPLQTDQAEVVVLFDVPKAGVYIFEYLYVDAFGQANPGTIQAVPIRQDMDGFTVELAGSPPLAGYVLRWRVVVIQIGSEPIPEPDPPQNLYINLPQAQTYTVFWPIPRTVLNYGFSELRVEYNGDIPIGPVITPMVILKAYDRFIIKLSETPANSFYYLVVRSP
jgi:hypothetical protein